MNDHLGTVINLGAFDIISSELVVSDPGYKPGSWDTGRLKNVRPSCWDADISMADLGDWGDRIAMLSIWHENAPEKGELNRHKADFVVGVDSGQVGFFDAAHCRDSSVIDTAPARTWLDSESVWYDRCCEITLSSMQAGILPFGTVSASGFGDGCYSCSYYTNSVGEILRAGIVFITEDELEDY